jgi:NADP-dependent 3-hydroxy acid dehydrogenase YdfG
MTSEALISTRFSAQGTALDVVDGVSLQGLRAVVTGASSGIGVETARARR